ncbi:complement component 1 Q subcomponent-binding protein, mitochondrial [Neocloeon triangulifer]|uniref:complement component 1 Q subcomponent-binding protein, mitochondrial n=1 Tax=Neocloeon triangulifer TaxID=2078957 RepID=UPI00286EF5ED|nr:complement component 1 Q subcomponent-binding protein, mitochondrial [Neocloeon triangulifer]
MNSIVKAATRFSSMKNALNPLRQVVLSGQNASLMNAAGTSRQITRSLWHMCSTNNTEISKFKSPSFTCTCGCSSKAVHTKAEKDLVDFLTEEIATEKKTQKKHGAVPKELGGFKIDAQCSEVTFFKESGDETIKVYFNVNHSVDADHDADRDASHAHENKDEHADMGEMRSQPSFEVELIRGETILGFSCSYLSADQQNPEDEYQDVFSIDEVTMYEGEWKEKTYAVSGEILDGNLYDLLMNLLEEKGISNEFVLDLSDFATRYEHSQYVGLLEKLQKFAAMK